MAPGSQPAVKKKTVHQLDTPFSSVAWPMISPEDQDTILELLCSLLKPLGQHRSDHIKRSKGKRAQKRKRRVGQAKDVLVDDDPIPPLPEIARSVDVGFNHITRKLAALPCRDESADRNSTGSENLHDAPKAYSMIFVARGDQSSAFNGHFPRMVGAASQHRSSDDKIRLVGFSKPCSERLSASLGIARASSIAIEKDASGAGALWEKVAQAVAPVDVPWLNGEGIGTTYLPTRINAIETTPGPKKAK